jgi:hypothetical protein
MTKLEAHRNYYPAQYFPTNKYSFDNLPICATITTPTHQTLTHIEQKNTAWKVQQFFIAFCTTLATLGFSFLIPNKWQLIVWHEAFTGKRFPRACIPLPAASTTLPPIFPLLPKTSPPPAMPSPPPPVSGSSGGAPNPIPPTGSGSLPNTIPPGPNNPPPRGLGNAPNNNRDPQGRRFYRMSDLFGRPPPPIPRYPFNRDRVPPRRQDPVSPHANDEDNVTPPQPPSRFRFGDDPPPQNDFNPNLANERTANEIREQIEVRGRLDTATLIRDCGATLSRLENSPPINYHDQEGALDLIINRYSKLQSANVDLRILKSKENLLDFQKLFINGLLIRYARCQTQYEEISRTNQLRIWVKTIIADFDAEALYLNTTPFDVDNSDSDDEDDLVTGSSSTREASGGFTSAQKHQLTTFFDQNFTLVADCQKRVCPPLYQPSDIVQRDITHLRANLTQIFTALRGFGGDRALIDETEGFLLEYVQSHQNIQVSGDTTNEGRIIRILSLIAKTILQDRMTDNVGSRTQIINSFSTLARAIDDIICAPVLLNLTETEYRKIKNKYTVNSYCESMIANIKDNYINIPIARFQRANQNLHANALNFVKCSKLREPLGLDDSFAQQDSLRNMDYGRLTDDQLDEIEREFNTKFICENIIDNFQNEAANMNYLLLQDLMLQSIRSKFRFQIPENAAYTDFGIYIRNTFFQTIIPDPTKPHETKLMINEKGAKLLLYGANYIVKHVTFELRREEEERPNSSPRGRDLSFSPPPQRRQVEPPAHIRAAIERRNHLTIDELIANCAIILNQMVAGPSQEAGPQAYIASLANSIQELNFDLRALKAREDQFTNQQKRQINNYFLIYTGFLTSYNNQSATNPEFVALPDEVLNLDTTLFRVAEANIAAADPTPALELTEEQKAELQNFFNRTFDLTINCQRRLCAPLYLPTDIELNDIAYLSPNLGTIFDQLIEKKIEEALHQNQIEEILPVTIERLARYIRTFDYQRIQDELGTGLPSLLEGLFIFIREQHIHCNDKTIQVITSILNSIQSQNSEIVRVIEINRRINTLIQTNTPKTEILALLFKAILRDETPAPQIFQSLSAISLEVNDVPNVIEKQYRKFCNKDDAKSQVEQMIANVKDHILSTPIQQLVNQSEGALNQNHALNFVKTSRLAGPCGLDPTLARLDNQRIVQGSLTDPQLTQVQRAFIQSFNYETVLELFKREASKMHFSLLIDLMVDGLNQKFNYALPRETITSGTPIFTYLRDTFFSAEEGDHFTINDQGLKLLLYTANYLQPRT